METSSSGRSVEREDRTEEMLQVIGRRRAWMDDDEEDDKEEEVDVDVDWGGSLRRYLQLQQSQPLLSQSCLDDTLPNVER
jgi:hypothetical protein